LAWVHTHRQDNPRAVGANLDADTPPD